MSIASLFKKCGLTEAEGEIYLSLLREGGQTISGLSRTTKLFRPSIYKALALLKGKKLVSLLSSGKRIVYTAEPPKILEEVARGLQKEISEIIPELESLRNRHGIKPLVRLVDGKEGLRSIFSDVVESLNAGEVFYRYTSESDLEKANSYLPADYRSRRDAKKLERYVISNQASGSKKKVRLERAMKIIPPQTELFEDNIIEIIYGNKVAFLDLTTETGVIMENPHIASFQKKIFKLLYARL